MILPQWLQLFVQQYLKCPDSFLKITQSLDKCVVFGSRGQWSIRFSCGILWSDLLSSKLQSLVRNCPNLMLLKGCSHLADAECKHSCGPSTNTPRNAAFYFCNSPELVAVRCSRNLVHVCHVRCPRKFRRGCTRLQITALAW